WEEHHRKVSHLRAKSLEQALGLRIIGRMLYVYPLIWNVVPRQEIPEFIGPWRPASAQHTDALKRWVIGSSPIIKQIVQLRIQVLRGRVPRFQKEIVDAGMINGADRGVCIGVCSKQRAFCSREDFHCLL